MTINLSPDQRSLIERLRSERPDEPFSYLDPADPEHRALIHHFLEAAGKDSSRYPALHRALSDAGLPSATQDSCVLVDLGRTKGGKATARAWLASRGGAYVSGVHTVVLDADSGEALAAGGATQVGGTLAQAATSGSEAKPASGRQTAVTFFHAQQAPDTPPRFGLASTTRGTPPAFPVTVHDPAPWRVRGPNTLIALCRMVDDTNWDYVYLGPDSQVDPDRLVVPFTGTAGPLPYAIGPGSTVYTQLYVTAPQTAWVDVRSDYDLYASTRFSIDGSTVTWAYKDPGTLPEGPALPKTIDLTSSIQYEAANQANDWVTAFYFQFTLPQPSLPPVVFTVCSTDWPQETSENCVTIPPIAYWWHCLAADTPVTLPDGTTRAIRDLDERATVRGAVTGAAVRVVATTRAFHGDNGGRDRAREVRTEGGRSLVLSGSHPVITPDGPVAARDLQVGVAVVVEGGTDRVTSCEPVAYDGIVCNLELEDRGPGGFGAFFAGGIAVGDQSALSDHFHATRHDPDHMLRRLPETHHQDYLSALADATSR